MDESIEWKEAKGGQIFTDSEEENDDEYNVKANSDQGDWETDDSLQHVTPVNDDDREKERLDETNDVIMNERVQIFDLPSSSSRTFKHQQINLSLRRNITALADPNQHKQPRQTFSSDEKFEPFDSWLENAIVATSPNADVLLFSSPNPEPMTFFAKLRMEPINQYITKALEIPLDHNEQVTSLLCLPIMSIRKTALGSVDWTALVVGLSSGYVKFYNEQSICLLSLKFCDEPAISIKCQTMKSNSNARSESHFASIVDEILITFKTLAIVVDGVCLYENLRISREEVIKNGSDYEPAYDLKNLPSILNCQKWRIGDPTKNSLVVDADLLGIRRTTVFDSMISDSVNFENIPTKACARTLAIVGRDPFISCYRESKEDTSHSYTEIIGSIFSLWNRPQPTRTQMTEVPKSSNISLFDKGRLAISITPSPDKRLIAITDDYGRVLLVDVTNWLVVRMWKGYRSAQCGWIEVKRDPYKRGCPHASFLIIYAPKRGLLEVWLAQRGPRVAAFNVGKSCRLLYSGYKMFNMRADQSQNSFAEQSYSSNCYLLNAKSETVFSVELPYTYSLYKYGDLKSRDQLLIGELVNAIQQDSEVELVSEILHRLALAKSIQSSIKKIAASLSPEKIVTLMENLIVKTMKNYDNYAGATMSDDDMSIIELCKRLIRLCAIFKELSETVPNELSLPDVNQRLIDQYDEHPQEIDEFSDQLGWSAPEILRYLSLLTLECSYRKNHQSNPWPSSGEPLTWSEFISCFDLNRIDNRKRLKNDQKDLEKVSIRLRELNSNFLNQDKVVKTALFLYHRLSENYHKFSQLSTRQILGSIANNYNYLEPSSRLALLFQFWLSTNLCNHWKMWAFLQNQIGQISDELKVIAMGHDNDKILIESWKPIYNLILESDNMYAAIIATAAIRSDTVRTIQDNEKREKLEASRRELTSQCEDDTKTNTKQSAIDWECLCIDAERMSILSQQLEDVFLLNLLLKYSVTDGYLIEDYLYRVPRISVANIIRGGPTIVSELVAQWAVQSNVNSKIFTQAYGKQLVEEEKFSISGPSTGSPAASLGNQRSKLFMARPSHLDSEEHAKELLHHVKTSYPCSLNPDIVLVNCVWEFCRGWTSNPSDKAQPLLRAYDCLSQISCPELRCNLASMAYKAFFQRAFERLVILIETNSTLLSAKNSRTRDTIIRKELNMGDDCLEEFVQFCCDISEFMLQVSIEKDKSDPENEAKSKNRLLTLDDWWATPTVVKMLDGPDSRHQRRPSQFSIASGSSGCDDGNLNSLIKTALFATNLLSVDVLVELNRLANLMNLIFKLKIVKAYPMSLTGDESRQILQFDLQQSSSGLAVPDIKNRTSSLSELRHKFARKCIVSIVNHMADDTNEFNYDDVFDDDVETNKGQSKQSAVAIKATAVAKQTRDKVNKTSGKVGTVNSLLDNNSDDVLFLKDENNESMVLFANVLSLANEWQLNCDELHLELVFELYRCNLDKIASQISTRVSDQQSLANGLLKISSQRVLVLFGLSPHISGSDWRRRSDKWSIFQPNVASWLKSIQQEEMRREIACLSFSDSLKPSSMSSNKGGSSFGVETYVLHALRRRTKLVLEKVTNHLEGQARRLAYDLLQLLESQHFDKQLHGES